MQPLNRPRLVDGLQDVIDTIERITKRDEATQTRNRLTAQELADRLEADLLRLRAALNDGEVSRIDCDRAAGNVCNRAWMTINQIRITTTPTFRDRREFAYYTTLLREYLEDFSTPSEQQSTEVKASRQHGNGCAMVSRDDRDRRPSEYEEHFVTIPAAILERHSSPEGCTNNDDMRRAANAVLAMTRTIRDLLPVEGKQVGGARALNALESAHNQAATDYLAFERVRNPLGFPWPGSGSFQWIDVTRRATTYYENVCSVMARVGEHYGWQSLSKLNWIDGQPEQAQRPHCQVRNGIPIPAIAPALLDSVELAARGLLAEVEKRAALPPSVPPLWEGGPPDSPIDNLAGVMSPAAGQTPTVGGNPDVSSDPAGNVFISVDRTTSAPQESQHPQEPMPFSGGKLVFFQDRVELCGADICSGPRCRTRRQILDSLGRKQSDGTFVAYSGEQLAEAVDLKGRRGTAAGAIRDLRDGIIESLRNEANVECGRHDVVLSGGRGYRFADCVSVHDGDQPDTMPITDTDEEGDVPNVRNDDVRDVPNAAVRSRRAWILQRLDEEHELQAPAVAKQFKCSVKTAQRDLQVLKEEGQIEFVGARRTGYYRLRTPLEPQR